MEDGRAQGNDMSLHRNAESDGRQIWTRRILESWANANLTAETKYAHHGGNVSESFFPGGEKSRDKGRRPQLLFAASSQFPTTTTTTTTYRLSTKRSVDDADDGTDGAEDLLTDFRFFLLSSVLLLLDDE